MAPDPEHSVYPVAFLFCQEVIHESDGFITPFRLIENAEIEVSGKPDAVWIPVSVNAFIAITCEETKSHTHKIKLAAIAPDGGSSIEGELLLELGNGSQIAYRNLHFMLNPKLPGRFAFVMWIDEKLIGTRYFVINHKPAPESPPA
jgi:hypothetical protein